MEKSAFSRYGTAMIRFAASALAAAVLASTAPAGAAPVPKEVVETLATTEAQDLAAVQSYLKSITSLRAQFQQIAPNRQVSAGTMSLQKPGKLRFEYTPPTPILVVSDGTVITLIDYDLKQVTRWPINDTPLRPLVRSDFMFGEDVEVVGIKRNAQWINVAITDPKKRDEGRMLLTFSRNPLKLTEWQVLDERGQTTIVTLDDLQFSPVGSGIVARQRGIGGLALQPRLQLRPKPLDGRHGACQGLAEAAIGHAFPPPAKQPLLKGHGHHLRNALGAARDDEGGGEVEPLHAHVQAPRLR